MVEEIKEEKQEVKEEKSLSDLLGMQFKDDGSWTSNDYGNVPVMRKLNRKERRKRNALDRKAK